MGGDGATTHRSGLHGRIALLVEQQRVLNTRLIELRAGTFVCCLLCFLVRESNIWGRL